MDEALKCAWTGKSGSQYRFEIYEIGNSRFNAMPGNYIYAKMVKGFWVPCYIGQADNLKNRLGNLKKEDCSLRNGATHIHAHANFGGEEARRLEQKDLILLHRPCCNEHHGG